VAGTRKLRLFYFRQKTMLLEMRGKEISCRLYGLAKKHLYEWNFFILFDIIQMIQNMNEQKNAGP